MADCSKTLEFSAELTRMCNAETEENGVCRDTCPFKKGERIITCPGSRSITQAEIDIVQKWSDEHPAQKPKTYLDKLKELFPLASCHSDGTPFICRDYLFANKSNSCVFKTGTRIVCPEICSGCWNEVMPDKNNNQLNES